jgi:hypothetical protein
MNELDVIRELLSEREPDRAARVRGDVARKLHAHIGSPPSPPRRPGRGLAIGVSLVAAAVAAFVLIGTSSDDQAPLHLAPADAKAALRSVARVAEQRTEPLLAPGQFWFVEERDRYMSTVGDHPPYSFLQPAEVRRTWTGHDGRGHFSSTHSGKAEFFGPRDRARWIADGSPQVDGAPVPGGGEDIAIGGGGFYFGNKKLSYDELSELPSDGPAMYRRLIKAAGGAGNSPDQEAFQIVGDMLRSSPVPPEVRASLYRALAYIKGIRLVGPVKDDLGRLGVAVELDDFNAHQRIVFDPKTALILEEQQLLDQAADYIDAKPGTIIGQRIVVAQGIVANDRERLP